MPFFTPQSNSRLVPTAMKAAAEKKKTKMMSQRKRNQRSVERYWNQTAVCVLSALWNRVSK